MVMWGALVALLAALAVLLLDPILAAFVVILLVTAAVNALVARDWDRHSTYEERELARAPATAPSGRPTRRGRPAGPSSNSVDPGRRTTYVSAACALAEPTCCGMA